MKRSQELSYTPGKFLAGALLLSAFSLAFYSIRDVLVQYGLLDVQYAFYAIGAIIQGTGGYLMIVFATTGFTSSRTQKIILPITGVLVALTVLAIAFGPTITIMKEAPFEPFPYLVVNHPWENMALNIAFLLSILFLVGLVFGVFLSQLRKTGTPQRRKKLLFYAFGIAFLFLPTILSVLVSPVFARIGYLVGAFLISKAFAMKGE